MTDEEEGLRLLDMELDLRAAMAFERATLQEWLSWLTDSMAAHVAARLSEEGFGGLADMFLDARMDPLSLTLRDLTTIAMANGSVPVVFMIDCPHPSTDANLVSVVQQFGRGPDDGGAE